MASNPWMKFYPADWRSDPRLRMCSLEARGLWLELICFMHESEPYGHLRIGSLVPTVAEIAKMVGINHQTVRRGLLELSKHGVYELSEDGVIWSRRMVRDFEKANKDKENGRKGGNPWVNPPVNGGDKAQKLEARIQKESIGDSDVSPPPKKPPYPQDFEDRFWKRYTKGSKPLALKEWKKLSAEDKDDACNAMERYQRSAGERQFWCDACRYLSQRRWENFVSNGTTIAPVIDIRAHLV